MSCRIKLFTPDDSGFALKAQSIQCKLFETGLPQLLGQRRTAAARPLPPCGGAPPPEGFGHFLHKQRRATYYRCAFLALGCAFLLLTCEVWHMKLATDLFPLLLSDELLRWIALVFSLCCCTGSFYLLCSINPFREQLSLHIKDSRDSLRRYGKELIADYNDQGAALPLKAVQRLRRRLYEAEEQLTALERRIKREYRGLCRDGGVTADKRAAHCCLLLERAEREARAIVSACRRQAID